MTSNSDKPEKDTKSPAPSSATGKSDKPEKGTKSPAPSSDTSKSDETENDYTERILAIMLERLVQEYTTLTQSLNDVQAMLEIFEPDTTDLTQILSSSVEG